MKCNFHIQTIVLIFYLSNSYGRLHYDFENNRNTFIESPKLYRRKDSVYYNFYPKSDRIKPNIRNKTNLRETDKLFLKQNTVANEDGDMILQFGISKPKPWRKDDDDSVAQNIKAEEPIDPPSNSSDKSTGNEVTDRQRPLSILRRFHTDLKEKLRNLHKLDISILSMHGCGQSQFMNQRIVNGKDVAPGAYPWVVVILKNGESWCGGTIINEEWVISAAHCFMSDLEANKYAIRVGTVNRNVGTTYRAVKVIVHERFHLDNMFNSDIALLKVGQRIKFGKLVNSVCLQKEPYEEPESPSVLVVGWGQTSFENKELPTILQEVILNRVDLKSCAQKYSVKGNTIYKSQICTWNKGQDACQGDSGSPAIEWRNKRAYIVGVVSYGSTCADELPGVYTKVSYYLHWIVHNIKN